MMDRLKDINFSDKKVASLDVKSLFTNVSVQGAMHAINTVVKFIDERQLPLPRNDYLELIDLCLKFNVFMFEEQEYAQQYGLAMGSPLSPAAACLFMELLEQEQFKNIMGPETTWLRYVDDVLIVAPRGMDVERRLQSLNDVEPTIQFSIENEVDDVFHS